MNSKVNFGVIPIFRFFLEIFDEGGGLNFSSPSIPIRDEVKWDWTYKKFPAEAKISPKLNLSNF